MLGVSVVPTGNACRLWIGRTRRGKHARSIPPHHASRNGDGPLQPAKSTRGITALDRRCRRGQGTVSWPWSTLCILLQYVNQGFGPRSYHENLLDLMGAEGPSDVER